MTFYEHAMLGITAALAVGLDRRYGWPIVVAAGAAATLPDWDGLSLAAGAVAYDRYHRVAGHNLLAAALLGAALAAWEWRCGWSRRIAAWMRRRWPNLGLPDDACEKRPRRVVDLAVWTAVGVVAAWSHLAADLLFSGHHQLPAWGVKLAWPFSDRAWLFPMVPWGDVGTTLLFAAGMFAMVRHPARRRLLATGTLLAVAAYILLRGTLLR